MDTARSKSLGTPTFPSSALSSSATASRQHTECDSPTALPIHLKLLDDTFRCKICHEHFKSAVIIKCGHSFCSTCIRVSWRTRITSLGRQPSCPQCRKEFTNRDIEAVLVPNRTLQESVLEWKSFLKRQGSTHGKLKDGSTSGASPTQKRSNSTAAFDPDGKRQKASSNVSTPMRKRPPLNCAGLKRKRVVELCQREGLPTTGTEQDLKDRYQFYLTLWNAEVDSINPRSQTQIVEEIKKTERIKKVERKREFASGSNLHAHHMAKLRDSRKLLGEMEGEATVTSGNATFDKQLNDGFSNLIRSYRDRNQRKPAPFAGGKADARRQSKNSS